MRPVTLPEEPTVQLVDPFQDIHSRLQISHLNENKKKEIHSHDRNYIVPFVKRFPTK